MFIRNKDIKKIVSSPEFDSVYWSHNYWLNPLNQNSATISPKMQAKLPKSLSTSSNAKSKCRQITSPVIKKEVEMQVKINHLLKAASCTNISPSSHAHAPFYNLLVVVLGAGVIAVVMIWDT